MNSKFRLSVILLTMFTGTWNLLHANIDMLMPDTLVLKDGTRLKGLIVDNKSDSVTIQRSHNEITVPKSKIVRILDESDDVSYFTEMQRKGSLPPWRMIVNDLRLHDKIKKFEQIPATVIDVGEFKNVPYQSFRINGDVELNIYGDPDDPAAVEIGVYGSRKNDRKLHAMLRQYLAGYLTSREEIKALYSIPPETGGAADAGDVRLWIMLPDHPEAFDGWWVGISNPKHLDKIRLSDAEYERLVRPADEVFDKEGNVLTSAWREEEVSLSRRVSQMGNSAKVFMRGFYRDAEGRFQMIYQDLPTLTQ